MKIWKKLFGSKQKRTEESRAQKSVPGKRESKEYDNKFEDLQGDSFDNLSRYSATAMVYKFEGLYTIEKNSRGHAIGIWLAQKPGDDKFLHGLLKMIVAMEKLKTEVSLLIYDSKYRVLPNRKDERGGFLVLFGLIDSGSEID